MPVVGTAPGLAAGFVVAAVGRRRRSTDAEVDVPLVSDLLASCLAAGASVPAALRAAAEAAPTGRERCLQVAERLLHGAPPEEAWATWLERPSLAPVARVLLRSAGTGAATTGEIRRAAERARTLRRAELARRAQRAGVWAVLPLGLCFLPAFVLVGVVPFALSLFGR
jgi:pilus assembly protein TadC